MATSPPANTPAWFLQYFEHRVVMSPTNEKWRAGHRAAAVWVAYHADAERATTASHTLVTIVTILRPYRRSGSGLYGLWLTIIGHLALLPVSVQCDVWQAIFAIADHDEHPLLFCREAQAVIAFWRNDAYGRERSPTMIDTFVALITPYCFDAHAYEWLALIDAIDQWMGVMPGQPTLSDMAVAASTQRMQA